MTIEYPEERVKKFFKELETQKSILTSITDTHTKLINTLTSLDETLFKKSHILDTQIADFRKKRQKTLHIRETTIPEREASLAASVQNNFEETTTLIKMFFRKMDSNGLIQFLLENRFSAREEDLAKAALDCVDLLTFVLDAVEDFVGLKMSVVKVEGVADRRCWAYGLLTHTALALPNQGVARSLKERAFKVLEIWKGVLLGSGEATMFLEIVIAFGLKHKFDDQFLMNMVKEFAGGRDMAKFALASGFGDKMGDIIEVGYPLPPAGEGREDMIHEAFFTLSYTSFFRCINFFARDKRISISSVAEDGRTAGDAQLIFPSQQRQTELHSLEAPTAVCEDVKMDDLESIYSISIMGVQESNAEATTFEEGIDYSIDLNIMHEDTLEAPILDLEELANKIRWIKRILHSHQPPRKAMEKNLKVGQLIEMKTFEKGFRCAWFRSKVIDIDLQENRVKLEYYDYDFEQEITWAKIYDVPPYGRKSSLKKKQLMLRPQYPLKYHKSELPPVNSISEICVVIDGAWKVGDKVDWYQDDCYWSATVIKVLRNDKVQVTLPMPPAGQGSDKDKLIAFCKDLRPSLDWSQRNGWTLPTVDGQTAAGAQLIFPSKQGMTSQREEVEHAVAAGSNSPLNASSTTGTGMGISVNSSVERQISEPMDTAVFEDVKTDDMESTASISSIRVEESKAAAAAEEDVDYSVDLNIMHEETLEAPILDLEELANKIKWIKSILHSHQPPSNDRTCWKFSN
ncbi:Agenet-like domain-containing protein [Artemisia annua]|uniref:FRIGIDA-like protein n=1 Tax=Artemisia annua TaxID=35608 RepID=A0A2U1KVQ4_ARTAN|nr:Agenet-like domain-containing protein [Artemisia annua]